LYQQSSSKRGSAGLLEELVLLYLLNGLAAGTLCCILLRVDKNPRGYPSKIKPSARAHLLLLQWHGATEAHRIGKLTAVAKEDESFNWLS